MAPENRIVAPEAPLVSPAASQTSTLQPPVPSDTDAAALDIGRANSLKRPRATTPTSPTASAGGLAHPDVSPSKFARLIDSTRYSGAPALTGQAAVEDEVRRREEEARLHPPDAISENPAQQALAALRGVEINMSRAHDAPATAAQSAADAATTKPSHSAMVPPVAAVANIDLHRGASPQSVASSHSIGSGGHVVHSPAPMDVDSRNERPGYLQPDAQMDEKSVSMSYPPVNLGAMPAPAAPARGMSLPSHSQNPDLAPRSPSSKKHKCPFCDTEFTRHHNLKSHLLTHSQEKPYVCQECQMRFRRLHDLKRHSKLHTGEKPHICPKCDRKFARGDALARHSKGAGGCAGRRSSMGSFAGDDDYEGGSTEADDTAMSGVVYDGNEDMTEEERRRLSLPAIKAQHVSGSGGAEGYGAHSRTYPPPGPRAGTTGAAQGPSSTSIPSMHSQQPSVTGAHSRASSGPSHGHSAGSGDSSANLFATDNGVWAYIQQLEARLQHQDDKIKQQDDQLRQQAERITALETKQGHETQMSFPANDLSSLRGQVAPPRPPPLEPAEQPPPPKI